MNDPQIWTLIAAFVGLQGVTIALLQRQLGAVESRLDSKIETQIGALDQKIDTQVGALDQKIDGLRDETRARFDHLETTMNAGFDHQSEIMTIRFGAVEQRLASLEDDMKLVKQHLLPPAA